jgi:hypothetical protein
MTARYRVIDTKGAYMARDPVPQLLQLGADHSAAAVYGIRAPVFELIRLGGELDFAGEPGPHLEPLNEEAREAMETYWAAHPGATLDPTRRMPLGQDPMGGKTTEQLVMGLLNAMDRGMGNAVPPAASQPSAELLALLVGQRAMQDAIAALTGVVAAQLAGAAAPPTAPPQTGRAR